MTTSTKPAADAAAVREQRLDEVLNMATGHGKTELKGAANRKVTAKATLSVSATEGDKTVDDGVEAAVTLGTSHSEKTEGGAKKS